MTIAVADAASMEALGAAVGVALGGRGGLLALRGDLGTGKTTFARGLLRRLGVQGMIRSPTYTLIEPYDIAGRNAFHLDLYRVLDPRELELMGVRDLLADGALVLIEWPENGGQALPAPDWSATLAHASPGRTVELREKEAGGDGVMAMLDLPPGCILLA